MVSVIFTIYKSDFHFHFNKLHSVFVSNYDLGMKNISNGIEMQVNSYSYQKLGKVLMCFSIYTNTKDIFNIKLDIGAIPAIHGLKFLNMCLIIITHNIHFALDCHGEQFRIYSYNVYFQVFLYFSFITKIVLFADNKVWFLRFIENYYAYIIHMISVLIDIYFFSSGCLISYLYLHIKTKENLNISTDCKERIIEFFVHMIKRFMR